MRFRKQCGSVEEVIGVKTDAGKTYNFSIILLKWQTCFEIISLVFLKCPYLTNSIFEVTPISWFSTSWTSIDPIHCRDPTNVAGLSPASTRAFMYWKTKNTDTRQLLRLHLGHFPDYQYLFSFKIEMSLYHEVLLIINGMLGTCWISLCVGMGLSVYPWCLNQEQIVCRER